MYVDPPAPRPFKGFKDENPQDPVGSLEKHGAFRFNPEYERLVEAWQNVMPHLEHLKTVLDKAYGLAKSPQTWDAPVAERYIQDIREWRNRLAAYRHSVLTAISDEAADTPRWLPIEADAPHGIP